MPALVPRGFPDSTPLEVSDDQVEFWTERGYVPQKSTTKKTAAKKASSSSKK